MCKINKRKQLKRKLDFSQERQHFRQPYVVTVKVSRAYTCGLAPLQVGVSNIKYNIHFKGNVW